MYVSNVFNALNNYPHQLHFEPVRDADCVRRHNWSPGYYEDADEALDHHVGAPADEALAIAPAMPEPDRAERKMEQATDGELETADA